MSQNKGQKEQIEDLRVRRTRKMLMQALIELTIEKGFAAITVQDIAHRAMINRATFYRHYLDKYDLLDKYMREIYALTEAQESRDIGDGESALLGMVQMFEHVAQHKAFYRAMLGPNGDPAFASRIRAFAEMRLRELIATKTKRARAKGVPVDLCLSYMAYAGVGAIEWWLNSDTEHTPAQIATWLTQLNQATVERVMG